MIRQFINVLMLMLFFSLFVSCGGDEENAPSIGENYNGNDNSNKQLAGTWAYKKFNQVGCEEFVSYDNTQTFTWKISEVDDQKFIFKDAYVYDGYIGTEASDEELVFHRVNESGKIFQDNTFAKPCIDNDKYPGNAYYGHGIIYGYDNYMTCEGSVCEGTYDFVMSQVSTSITDDSGSGGNNNPVGYDFSEEADYYCRLADAKKEVYDACNDNPDSGPTDCNSEASEYQQYSRLCSQFR